MPSSSPPALKWLIPLPGRSRHNGFWMDLGRKTTNKGPELCCKSAVYQLLVDKTQMLVFRGLV